MSTSDDPRKNRVIARLKAAGIAYSFGDTYEQLLEKLSAAKPVLTSTAPATVATANATAPGAAYVQAEAASAATLANALKAQLNVVIARLAELEGDLEA